MQLSQLPIGTGNPPAGQMQIRDELFFNGTDNFIEIIIILNISEFRLLTKIKPIESKFGFVLIETLLFQNDLNPKSQTILSQRSTTKAENILGILSALMDTINLILIGIL